MGLELTKIFHFDMAHRLSFHEGKCRNLHGHSYRLEVTLGGEPDVNGMIIDFNEMKRIVNKEVVDILDHATVIYENDVLLMKSFPRELHHVVFPYEVTAENLCRWIYERLTDTGLHIKQVTVWETADSKAVFTK
ncbi:MAG: 6-carboxytetrahydropterin synthase QueD [Candidatus Marinimicrobia bacterium]|nr:6-carboxytetrahydropterin synthase QueD [Candidatus Neomarinimicrobiota bacterium]